MHPWYCCRTCLATQSLNPIFTIVDHHEKYTSVIYIATGTKVEINDNFPQLICTTCINFINESYKYRKKCEDAQKTLENRMHNKDVNIKYENVKETFKTEDKVSIDISDLIVDGFSDLDDNITLDEYQCNFKIETIKDDLQVYETTVKDIVENPLETVFSKKKERAVKRKVKSKKENKEEKRTKEKAVRVREEIECEYCHKILTSKLSLRNHYKIHTGFDVVCEHCGKKFITRRLLLMHCRAKHGYEKTDKCSYCDYRASNAEQVKIHERLHTGEKPYTCSDCGAGFHRKSSYLQHIAIHLPEKTVQCDQCPARFKSVTLMRIHKNRHRAPQYTFRCRVCDNSFARRRNVVRHFQRIHGIEAKEQDIDRVKIG